MMNPYIPDLMGTVAPALTQADNATQQQSALMQTLLGTKGDKLATLLYGHNAVPEAPRLNFGVNAGSVGEGIVQGLGNVFNNSMQMRRYGQEQQQYRDLAEVARRRDIAAAQQQQDFALKENEFLSRLPAEAQQAYGLLDDVGRRQFLLGDAQPYLGKRVGEGEGNKTIAAQPGKTQADIASAAAQRQEKERQFQEITGLTVPQAIAALNKGALTPDRAAAWKYTIGGDVPSDLVDYNNRLNEATQTSIKTQAAPTLTAQEIEQNNLTMQSTRLGNLLKNIQIQFEPDRLKASIASSQLSNQEKANKLERIESAVQIFNAYQDRAARGEVTAQDIANVQSNIGMLAGLDPRLDNTLKTMLGKKSDDKLSDKDLQTFFKQSINPNTPATPSGLRSIGGFYYDASTGEFYKDIKR